MRGCKRASDSSVRWTAPVFLLMVCVGGGRLQAGAGDKACAAYLNSCELFSVPEPLIAVAMASLGAPDADTHASAVPMLLQVGKRTCCDGCGRGGGGLGASA